DFAEELLPALQEGIAYLGGCCGTTPDFIRVLRERLASPALSGGQAAGSEKPPRKDGICSATNTAVFDGVRVIGERINPTGKKRFQQALREQDLDYIVARGLEQQDAGADILDVNVGLPGIDEPAMMARTVKALQAVIDLPLQIDSSNPEAIEAGLRAVNGRAIVNSVSGKAESLETILPLCRKYGAKVVGLCLDENGIPETWQARAAIAARILNAALKIGMPKEDVLIDCLTLTVSVQQNQAAETLKAVRHVRETLGLHTVLGVSNISFGLPARENITVSFLTQALSAGLDLPIVNPNQEAVMDAIASYRVLSGEDRDSEAYIHRFTSREAVPKTVPAAEAASGLSLTDCVLRGLRGETARMTEKALETQGEMAVIDELLIPALDKVGALYEKQEIFLPQLMNAANAACGGFDVIRRRLAQSGVQAASKGKILLATVYGDIHDIGKNIVRTVLENYGYTVIDLGRDVPAETVVETAIREDIKLVGLSALMTTTVSSMADTIAALRRSGHDCRIMVGGAVLTPEYAAEIGADYYAKDAKQSADIARLVLG
ncbi:MAG: dihydropteroate synthase, partial [Oscillospiraceae bacterium]|nr:dihydropteroate synthase [Oscillospiraceae bacterium]